ncbi:uncharacterized protein LOC130190411 isoform X2 [Pseudoliparis swirei]|uniref:uncharacterized protein LOC130190411 isoform X2 n=1 Tax=Pseudoliparis swirei TaxID=2059687 RepID=UPI0024BD9E50|nr:uncharacterized protein LOC130190411 isoform X2 [Pseudoliparis swirei]
MTGSVIGSEVLFLLLFFVHASRCAVACLCKNLSKVNFLCLPYRPCGRGNRQRKGANGKSGNAEIGRRDLCDPLRTPGSNKWEQDCTRGNQSNATDPESLSGGAGEDPEKNWFMCEADMDMAELQRIMSSSALKTHLEVSVELQLSDAETLNLTLYSGSNHSSLHLHPPGEDEEEEEEGSEDEGQRRVFYCCLPVPPAAESANPRHCLLWLANRMVWSATAQEKLPWKRSQRENPAVLPLGYAVTGQQLNDGEDTEISIPKGLSPIQEVDTQDDIETLLDGNVDHCYAANLHHRIHHSTSSLTEEQIC